MRSFDGHLAVLVGLIVMLLTVGAYASGGTYLSLFNLQSMANQVPEIGLLAIGVMLAMCVGNGGIDLSGIALANLSGVVSAIVVSGLLPPSESPLGFSIAFVVLAVGLGVVGGMLNGVLISYLKITPILCTLGTQMLFTGLAVVASGGRSVTVGTSGILYDIGNGLLMQVPVSFLIFAAVAGGLALVLRLTPFGVWVMMSGSNPVAAQYAGFPKHKIVITTYTLSGTLAGISGVIIASRNVNVKWDYGTSYLLIAILIAVMAGVRPEGGYGRVICVVLSAITLQLMSSLLNFMGFSNFVRDFAWGVLLLLFLAVGRYQVIDTLRMLFHPATSSAQRPSGTGVSD